MGEVEHVVVFAPHESQHPAQWQQRCRELHHNSLKDYKKPKPKVL
jgi:hypothetical protein